MMNYELFTWMWSLSDVGILNSGDSMLSRMTDYSNESKMNERDWFSSWYVVFRTEGSSPIEQKGIKSGFPYSDFLVVFSHL